MVTIRNGVISVSEQSSSTTAPIGSAARKWALGADVVFVEGRDEHVQELRARLPMIDQHKILMADLDGGVNLGRDFGRFDLIIHLGLLYHLHNWRQSLSDCAALAPLMVLETAVSDGDDPTFRAEGARARGLPSITSRHWDTPLR
jgi:hypothetical protein